MSSDVYQDIKTLYEPIVAAYKEEIEELDLFKVSEGEGLYESGLEAWVIPGRDRIDATAMRMLQHFLELNVIVFASAEDSTLPQLREYGEQVYNKLMEDITHGGTCKWALPMLFHPGYMQVQGVTTVGVLMQYTCHFTQLFNLPSS